MSENKKPIINVYNRKEERWLKWMELGARTGCHQMPERSFFIGRYQFPVCARCTGVLIGYVLAVISFCRKRRSPVTATLGCLAMLTDWALQRSGKLSSTNRRRFLTGIAGGFGVVMLQLLALQKLVHKVKH